MPQFVSSTLLAFLIYLCIVLAIGFYAYLKTRTAGDFLLGGRQLGPSVSAISASASDMILRAIQHVPFLRIAPALVPMLK